MHRPLEKPILGKASDVAAFDAAIDRGSASVASRPVPRRRKLTVEAEAPASAKPPALPTIPPGYSDILLPSFDWATGLHSSSAPERR